MSKSSEIWKKLSSIDVNGKTEKKGNLTYLSWAWAWGTLMDHYPQATYKFDEHQTLSDGSMMVFVTVDIDGVSHDMWLPVIDYKNKAIKNPDAMAVNTARMRCLTKCLAMFGLGHYIYAGEDLPESVKEEQVHKKEIFKSFNYALTNNNPLGIFEVAEQLTNEQWASLTNSVQGDEKENKTAKKQRLRDLLSEGRNQYRALIENCTAFKSAGDDLGIGSELADVSDFVKSMVMKQVNRIGA